MEICVCKCPILANASVVIRNSHLPVVASVITPSFQISPPFSGFTMKIFTSCPVKSRGTPLLNRDTSKYRLLLSPCTSVIMLFGFLFTSISSRLYVFAIFLTPSKKSASKKHIRFIFRCAFLDRISFFCYHKHKRRIATFRRAASPNVWV